MQGGEPQLPDGVTIGEIVADRYRIDAIIGWGAMGIVVAAHDQRLDIPVAIKFLLAAASDRARAIPRFVLEARAAARLQSEHVARVSDVAVHEATVPYIVMERLIGVDLAKLLETRGPIAAETAVDHILEACEAIAEAHRIDIIHRDLKPSNLFLAQRRGAGSRIKVLDFGIAKNTRLVAETIDAERSLSDAALTGQKAILGSPLYMSPEQMESSGEVDARTDIWALGVTLFELVTGKPPYTGTSLVQVYSRMTARGEPAWRSQTDHFPPGLPEVIEKCLKADRTARYGTVSELAAALAPFGSRRAKDSEARIRKTALLSRVGLDATLNVVMPRSPTPHSSGPPVSKTLPVAPRGLSLRRAVAALLAISGVGIAAAFLGQRHAQVVSAARAPSDQAEPAASDSSWAVLRLPSGDASPDSVFPSVSAAPALPLATTRRTPGVTARPGMAAPPTRPSDVTEPVDAAAPLQAPPSAADAGFNTKDLLKERM
jgi:serine/threonine protein kinase